MRPVVDDIAQRLPAEIDVDAPGIPLRRRLLAALPAINVITGVLVVSVVNRGESDLADLAFAALIAAAVASTISLALILLLSDSVTRPLGALTDATEQVGEGDFDVRVPVVTTDETGILARAFNRMVSGLAERERIRDAFGTYVDREVAEHILQEGTALEGEEVEVTMMFLDIRDFTGYAERAEASEVVATLNRLWERVVPVIHDHRGHVDKFVGDGLLAVFGAPRRQADHADQALRAALEIARAVDDEFGEELGIGIGLNSGTVVVGNVGGAGRLEFSVIGDAVNTAARIQAATRQTGDTILVAERTKELLGEADVPLSERPNVALKGKRESMASFRHNRLPRWKAEASHDGRFHPAHRCDGRDDGGDDGRNGGGSRLGQRPPAQEARRRDVRPAADPEEVAPRVYRLGTRWVNFYLVTDGDDAVLVDSGYPGYFSQLEHLVRGLGVVLEGIRAVIVTHHHVDHAGTAEAVRSQAGAAVFIGEGDAAIVQGEHPSHPPHGFWRESWRPSMIGYLLHSARVGGARYRAVKSVTTLDGERSLDVPGRLRVIPTPGHTAGHCSLLLEDRGVLFSGDAMVNFDYATGERGVKLHRFNEDRERARASLERLEGIDVETILFGHGDPWMRGLDNAIELAREA
jgi:class 3 adenylate cyclase/glyoxylase-like metal-dependent hydrolase (beta-lactamase superfamily II)